ncbi:carbon-nitrogen hydrolase [Suhomyces tanzawaensis NRRL Y-17324]|uniref:Carbon-nitrogen hydrolase n=1 Tax=Suhomyces tanzawaensis NRRL Y-17324 TaxID=984487 RepID=A0A1E4SCQ1_9ASCO|nr:carbon-nitrogen hydrolase [Suhomyces tanzawaensis NRRL Y-17324]ODV77273.1 carbon-nitrogen hydrolase [Suhomyces tanzawaensis NRRL Y-17324]
MKLKIACLQLNPAIHQVEANVAKVRTLLASVKDALDIVVLPELAITGYNFQSRKAIEPYLEQGDTGRSVALAQEIARLRNCFAVIGYPELHQSTIYNLAVVVGPHGQVVHRYRKTFLYEADERWGCSENPQRDFAAFDLVLDRDYYRETQGGSGTASSEGTGNASSEGTGNASSEGSSLPTSDGLKSGLSQGELSQSELSHLSHTSNSQASHTSDVFPLASSRTSVRVNLGICMDLNPYKFEAPFNAFEFAMRCYDQQARLVLCPMAWLLPHSPSIDSKHGWSASEKLRQGNAFALRHFSASPRYEINTGNSPPPSASPASTAGDSPFTPAVPCTSTVDYWILRFFPFLNHPHSLPKAFRSVTVVTCNRSGVEHDVVYGGSSSIFQFDGTAPSSTAIDSSNPSVSVLGSLGQGLEGILVREVDVEVTLG